MNNSNKTIQNSILINHTLEGGKENQSKLIYCFKFVSGISKDFKNSNQSGYIYNNSNYENMINLNTENYDYHKNKNETNFIKLKKSEYSNVYEKQYYTYDNIVINEVSNKRKKNSIKDDGNIFF